MRGEGCVAGEGKLVGVPKFHSWGKCTMALRISTQIGCSMLPVACVLYIILHGFLICSLGYYSDAEFCMASLIVH